MHDGDDCDAQLVGELYQRSEHTADIGVAETIDAVSAGAQVRGDRINQNSDDVADLLDLPAQQVEIFSQTEHAPALATVFDVAVMNHLDDFDAIEIGAGCGEPRHQSVGGGIFAGQQ